jgi:2-succinyl-6-hydroxy-2,4-cyclohexadiene-1-carboxylate synthase
LSITALHGFLGLPADWGFLRQAGFDVNAIDVFGQAVPPEGDVLLGYSLGGRLALQALLGGARYRKAIIVSARISAAEPGRLERDEIWAQRFEAEEWGTLIYDWNAQSIFGGHAMPRAEQDFDRRTLARVLRDWSPAVLPVVESRLLEIMIPVLWIAGERDLKYAAEGQHAVSLLPNAELALVPDAGHRVPWERPAEFVELVRNTVDG